MRFDSLKHVGRLWLDICDGRGETSPLSLGSATPRSDLILPSGVTWDASFTVLVCVVRSDSASIQFRSHWRCGWQVHAFRIDDIAGRLMVRDCSRVIAAVIESWYETIEKDTLCPAEFWFAVDMTNLIVFTPSSFSSESVVADDSGDHGESSPVMRLARGTVLCMNVQSLPSHCFGSPIALPLQVWVISQGRICLILWELLSQRLWGDWSGTLSENTSYNVIVCGFCDHDWSLSTLRHWSNLNFGLDWQKSSVFEVWTILQSVIRRISLCSECGTSKIVNSQHEITQLQFQAEISACHSATQQQAEWLPFFRCSRSFIPIHVTGDDGGLGKSQGHTYHSYRTPSDIQTYLTLLRQPFPIHCSYMNNIIDPGSNNHLSDVHSPKKEQVNSE
jgi:hypothetical protein